jgi:hypothetical protein
MCQRNSCSRIKADAETGIIRDRFGTILSCEVIRDKKSGDSLQYAFIEFDKKEEAEAVSFPPLRHFNKKILTPYMSREVVGILQDERSVDR